MVAMLKPIAPFVEYAINKDYIAKALCINQDKPELKCGGKCHLMKQLEKQEKEEQKQLRVSLEEYPIGFVKVYAQKSDVHTELNQKNTYKTSQQYSYLYYHKIFHPPAV